MKKDSSGKFESLVRTRILSTWVWVSWGLNWKSICSEAKNRSYNIFEVFNIQTKTIVCLVKSFCKPRVTISKGQPRTLMCVVEPGWITCFQHVGTFSGITLIEFFPAKVTFKSSEVESRKFQFARKFSFKLERLDSPCNGKCDLGLCVTHWQWSARSRYPCWWKWPPFEDIQLYTEEKPWQQQFNFPSTKLNYPLNGVYLFTLHDYKECHKANT